MAVRNSRWRALRLEQAANAAARPGEALPEGHTSTPVRGSARPGCCIPAPVRAAHGAAQRAVAKGCAGHQVELPREEPPERERRAVEGNKAVGVVARSLAQVPEPIDGRMYNVVGRADSARREGRSRVAHTVETGVAGADRREALVAVDSTAPGSETCFVRGHTLLPRKRLVDCW